MKYIDAEKLKAEIKDRLHCNGSFDECGDTAWDYDQGMVAAYNYVLSFIDSLQQEQKPAEWSEEDKFKLEDAITGIDVGIGFYETEGKHPNLLKAIIEAKEWLKSLRPQPKPEWSEEDEIGLEETMWCVNEAVQNAKTESEKQNAKTAENWLNSLRPKPKVEWSVEKEPVDLEKEIKKHTDLFQADIEYPLRLTAIKFYELGRKEVVNARTQQRILRGCPKNENGTKGVFQDKEQGYTC